MHEGDCSESRRPWSSPEGSCIIPESRSLNSSLSSFVVAIGLAAIRSGSPAWSGAMLSITLFAMICSLLGIALGRGTRAC